MSQRFRIRTNFEDLWEIFQPGPFREKQPQWLTPQLCLATAGVQAAQQMTYNILIHKVSLTPSQERNGAKTGDDDDVEAVFMLKTFVVLVLVLAVLKCSWWQ